MGCGFRILMLGCFLAGLLVLGVNLNLNFTDGYRFDYGGVKTEKKEIGELEPSIRKVIVENQFGDVSVKASAESPRWEWDGATWATDAEASARFLEDLHIHVSTTGDVQTWKLEMPDRDSNLRGVRSDLTLYVPEFVDVQLTNGFGAILSDGIRGQVGIENRHGNIEVRKLGGPFEITNRHGSILAESLTCAGTVSNQHGKTTLSFIKCKKSDDGSSAVPLKITSRHGDVILTDIDAKITAKMSHGDLTGDGLKNDVSFNSSHGGVQLSFANDLIHTIEGSCSHSRVRINVPGLEKAQVNVNLRHGRLRTEVNNDGNAPTKIQIEGSHTDVSISNSK